MKLYKFRALANDDGKDGDLEHLKRILETGEFWCSKFSELNDPLEGFYTVLNDSIVTDTLEKKEGYKICSFSSKKAFSNPAMWGYYANGFRGVAIEIEISLKEVKRITYDPEIPEVKDLKDVEKILTTKLIPWQHEHEYRFLKESSSNYFKIGKITALYYGDPYKRAVNRPEIIANTNVLEEYIELRRKILKFIKNSPKTKNLEVYPVKIENCKVISLISTK